MALVDIGLVVRYYIDEAASGQVPPSVLDGSGVGADFDLTINYTASLNYAEISGNRGLESTSTAGAHRADKAIDDISDKVRDNIHGAKTATIEIVVRVDDFAAGTGRCFVINPPAGANVVIGLTGTSGTNANVYFNQTLMRSFDPGSVRAVFHIVIDTALATANDRIKIYKDGVLQSPTINANPALNATISIPSSSRIFMLNRHLSGATYDRSMDGVLFYGAMYSVAMPQADITTNFDILTADDDTPAGGETPVSQTAESDYEGLEGLSLSEQKAFESLVGVRREL